MRLVDVRSTAARGAPRAPAVAGAATLEPTLSAMRPKGNHESHPGLVWRRAPTMGFELTISGFQQPLGRAVPLADGRWRTVVRAPGRPVQGATAANLNQARLWLTKWATPIAWRHRPTVCHAGFFRSAPSSALQVREAASGWK